VPAKVLDPVPRITRALQRWGAKVRRVVLELGRTQIHEWEHDGNDAHANELANAIAEIAQDTCAELERDCSFQLSAYEENGRSVGSAPLKVALPTDETATNTAKATENENNGQKHNAQLLRHNEQLFQRFLALSEQQTATLGRSLDAQGRIVDTLSARLASTEKQLQEALAREQEAQSLTREALVTLDELLKQAPNSGFKNMLEKIGATLGLLEQVKDNAQVKQFLTSLFQQKTEAAKQLNGTPQSTPTAEQPTPAATETPTEETKQ